MDLVLQSPKVSELQDSSLDMINLKPEDCFDFGNDRFIPVELIDSTTLKTQESREIENVKERDWEGILSTELGNKKAEEMGILLVEKMAQIIAMVESMDMSKDPNLDSVEESDVNCGNDVELVMVALDDSAQHSAQLASEHIVSLPCSIPADAFTAMNDQQADEHSEEPKDIDSELSIEETKFMNLIEKEMCIQLNNHTEDEETISLQPCAQALANDCNGNDTDLDTLVAKKDQASEFRLLVSCSKQTEEVNEERSALVERIEQPITTRPLSIATSEFDEMDEEKNLGLRHLSMERSASAIAANQTMAMITRLHEEKSAMQMEALQYQRTMDEQSEYDQEAFQLLNELMVKREREKQEMEKELEIYRKKVLLYENEKKMMRRKSNSGKSGTSSASGNATDSEELFVDLNNENTDEYNFYALIKIVLLIDSKQLSTLDESLADFEEERRSILEQLKALEEKLFTLEDDEHEEGEQLFEDTKNYDESNEEEIVNGHLNDYKKHYGEKTHGGAKAKKLLPLFNEAIDVENEDEFTNDEHEAGSYAVFSPNSSMSKFTSDEKKLALIEEVDHDYERLHALEADREFLKYCLTSLKKGDKGMDLLQEILQHLRDLRNVDLHVRDMSDASLNQSFSH
ncbi:hypothetical protein MKX03_024996 [Papaver bracteatum]|nr:hypothetical protein MKX03_024996 [Papaver bracteatum]